jgi:hypothetical protein
MLQYLKKLKNKLQVLNLDNNDFQKEEKNEKKGAEMYRYKVIAWLKDLKYLDYQIITED